MKKEIEISCWTKSVSKKMSRVDRPKKRTRSELKDIQQENETQDETDSANSDAEALINSIVSTEEALGNLANEKQIEKDELLEEIKKLKKKRLRKLNNKYDNLLNFGTMW